MEDAKKRRFAIAVLMVLLFFIALETTVNRPFGLVFSWLLSSIPYLMVLRMTYVALYSFMSFLISFLFGISVIAMLKRLDGSRRTYLIVTILVLIALSVYLFDLTESQRSQSTQYNSYSIPPYVLNVSNYINSHVGSFAVATLPVVWSWTGYRLTTWYSGTDVYSCLMLDHAVYTGGWNCLNEMFFPVSKAQYSAVGNAVAKGTIGPGSLVRMLDIYGVRYVIYEGDALNSSERVASALASANGLTLIHNYNGTILYENKGYNPLVYASDIEVSNNSTDTYLINAIATSHSGVDGTSFYGANSLGFSGGAKGMNVAAIPGFRQPELNFSEDSPTTITVRVADATTPYYLVLRETYDPQWTASYGNGTAVPQARHIQVNGFANAWYVNETGSYTITLDYAPQAYAWYSLAASLAGAGIIAYMGLLAFRKPGKRKMKRRRS